jgi:hypothetical protein
MTLPVLLSEAPEHVVEIQVILDLEHAAELASALQPAIKMATVRGRQR